MWVLILDVWVGDQHLWSLFTKDGDQFLCSFIKRSLMEALRVGIGFGIRHPGVAVVEVNYSVIANDRRCLFQLASANILEVGFDGHGIERWIMDVTLGAIGAANEDRSNAFGSITGDRSRSF